MLRVAHRLLSQAHDPLPEDYFGRKLGVVNAERAATVSSLEKGVPIIIADNVAKYVHDFGEMTTDQLPPFRLPFNKFFVEWNETTPYRTNDVIQCGYYVFRMPITEEWISDPDFYSKRKNEIADAFFSTHYVTLSNGKCIPIRSVRTVMSSDNTILAGCVYWHNDCPEAMTWPQSPTWEDCILHFTLAFMQCTNVEQVDVTKKEGPIPKWCRRQRLPELKYSTLVIDPNIGRKPRTGDRKTEGDRSGKALHICRGHFMHSINDGVSKGLFGRGIYGTFWVPAHVRGSADLGKVIPTYNVLAPTG